MMDENPDEEYSGPSAYVYNKPQERKRWEPYSKSHHNNQSRPFRKFRRWQRLPAHPGEPPPPPSSSSLLHSEWIQILLGIHVGIKYFWISNFFWESSQSTTFSFFFLNNGIMTCYSASTWLMCIRLFFSQNSTGYSEILLFQKQWIVTRNRLQRPSQVKMLKWNSVGRIRIHSRKTLRRFLYFVLTF